MKVLIYSHAFAPLIGGVETYVMLLAQGLANDNDSGHQRSTIQVTVVTEAFAQGFDDGALPFRVVRRPGFIKLCRFILQTDILQVAGPCLVPMFIARFLRKPFVIEQHGYQSICPNGSLLFGPTRQVCPGHFMAKHYAKCWECNRSVGVMKNLKMLSLTFVRRWFSNRATVNAAITRHVQKRLQLRNSSVIYYGIPDTVQIESLSSQTVSSTPLRFAYLGRLVSEKGLDILLEAAAMLKREGIDFRLKFIGDGPERTILERKVIAEKLEREVSFTGFLSGEALQNALNDVAVMVMPSLTEETAGLSAIEQMMRGRLVICSDIGGLGEVVDGAGLKFTPGNALALADLMRQTLKNPAIVEEFGRKARERALQCFALDRMLREHIELYREVMERNLRDRQPATESR